MITASLFEPVQTQKRLAALYHELKGDLLQGRRFVLTVREETRSGAQNRLLWQRLGELSAQVTWHGMKLAADEWKEACTAALKRQKVIPGIEGGFVVIGAKTSKMTKAEVTELLDFISAFGAQQGVTFADETEVIDSSNPDKR